MGTEEGRKEAQEKGERKTKDFRFGPAYFVQGIREEKEEEEEERGGKGKKHSLLCRCCACVPAYSVYLSESVFYHQKKEECIHTHTHTHIEREREIGRIKRRDDGRRDDEGHHFR